MKLLLLLMSVMTFTVQTMNSVQAEGSWPYDMDASYACTYQKGDVRAGDTATLHIFGLDGIIVEKIEVYLKSNKSSGAGILTIGVDGNEIERREGTYKDWFGAYNNETFQPIGWSGSCIANTIDVQLIGTAKSLHIEKYEITWSQAPAQSYTVTLMDGFVPHDTLHGAQVTLPVLDDLDGWQFVGWTDRAFRDEWILPGTAIPAGLYTPAKDETLWAVYQAIIPPESYLVSDLSDGVYCYANYAKLKAMSGGVVDGVVGVADWNLADETQLYEITFDEEGKATIRLLYVYGEEYIGFNGTKLANTPAKWNVYHEGTKTAFYTESAGKIYLLYPNYLKEIGNDEYILCTALIEVADLATTPTVLLYGSLATDPLYTCYPNVPYNVETIPEETTKGEYIIPFGIYEIRIQNGKKYLQLR